MKLRLSFVVISCLTSYSLADGTICPRTKFQVGKTYRQAVTMTQEATTPGGAMNTEMVTELSMKVAAGTAKDTLQLTMRYESMKLKSAMGDKEMLKFDSNDKEAKGEPTLSSMVGKDIGLTLNKDNKVLSVTGMDQLSDNPMVKQMFNSESMKELMSQTSLIGAPKEISKGESWEFSKAMPNPMLSIGMKGKYTYTTNVAEEGHQQAVFDVKSEITMAPAEEGDAKAEDEDPKAAQMKQMMKSMGMKITEGGMTGKSYFDPEIGFIRHAEMDINMTMSMKNPQSGEKMDIPSKQRVTVKLLGIEDTK
jgi:hypothetical protein